MEIDNFDAGGSEKLVRHCMLVHVPLVSSNEHVDDLNLGVEVALLDPFEIVAHRLQVAAESILVPRGQKPFN